MIIDLTGKRFGKLKVLGMARYPNWLCLCDCGNKTIAWSGNLNNGHTRSCGCLVKKHGMVYTSEYRTWHSLKHRCLNPKSEMYKIYGGRGITICPRWLHSFENFYADMGKKPTTLHTIDRIDNNKGYSPENCRWATWKEQANNRRNRTSVKFNSQTKSVSEWAEIYHIPQNTLWNRIYLYKWSIQRAFGLTHKIEKTNH